jgi:hypothetical protein
LDNTGEEEMTISAPPIAFFADFSRKRALRCMFVATVLAAISAPATADAQAGQVGSGRRL